MNIFSNQERKEISHLLRDKIMKINDAIHEEEEEEDLRSVVNLHSKLEFVRNTYEHLDTQLAREELELIIDLVRTKIIRLNCDFFDIVDNEETSNYFQHELKTLETLETKLSRELKE